MALINCPNCGNEISDKADKCPNCGYVLKEPKKVVCSECGTEIEEGTLVCPKCGNPIKNEEEFQKVELSKVAIPKIKINKKIIVGICAAIVLVIGIIFGISSNSEKKFIKNYKTAVLTMLSGAAKAESVCGDIHDVWYNSIQHEFDPNTNKYTLTNDGYYTYSSESGEATSSQRRYFNDDFNVSLSKYFADSSYQSSVSYLRGNQDSVNSLMSKLSKVPKGYENAYTALDELYDSYLELTDLALDPKGSLQTFTSSFNSADSSTLSAYKKANNFAENFK